MNYLLELSQNCSSGVIRFWPCIGTVSFGALVGTTLYKSIYLFFCWWVCTEFCPAATISRL